MNIVHVIGGTSLAAGAGGGKGRTLTAERGRDRDNLDNSARQKGGNAMQAIRVLKNYWLRFRWSAVLFLRRFAVTRTILQSVLSPVKAVLVSMRVKRRKFKFMDKFPTASPGSAAWLVGTEIKYGGWTRIPVNVLNPHDPRSAYSHERSSYVHDTGGDRMLHNGYAEKYAEYLSHYVGKQDAITLAEFGILKGTGLAIWSELFPNGRILGFDINLENARHNMNFLKERGAFQTLSPELHKYDQFNDNTEYLGRILDGARVDICIDDGFHTSETILATMKSVMPYLADRFVYFVEDNPFVHGKIRALYPHLKVDSAGQFTIVSRGA